MKRDLYTEVSARIVAELEAGAAPWNGEVMIRLVVVRLAGA